MKAAGMVQTVIIMLLLASAASCEVGKIYSARLFPAADERKAENKNRKFMEPDTTVIHELKTVTTQIAQDTLNEKVSNLEKLPATKPNTAITRTKRVRQ
jgi:hypothetical protein